MRICLISRDVTLNELIRKVEGAKVIFNAPGDELPDSDLYLWDLESGSLPPSVSSRAEGRHLFLVDRRNLASLGQRLKDETACILLKPLNRATLEAFMTPWVKEGAQPCTPAASDQIEALLSDRDSLLQYVLQANLKLQEYDQDRTNFLARTLHDFRAPLTALNGYCGLLLDGELGAINPQQTNLLRRMQRSAERMETLANSLLALSVEGHMQRNLQIEPDDLEDCLSQALHDLYSLIEEKHIVIASQLDPPEQPMFFERQKIEQVFINLIENACKFTPKHGGISIRGYSQYWDPAEPPLDDSAMASNAYRIDIQDSGPGVELELRDKIFEQYTSYSLNGDRSGGGLGLAICKLIVTAHGGKIWVGPSDRGAIFSFILPFEPKLVLARRAPMTEILENRGHMTAVSGQ